MYKFKKRLMPKTWEKRIKEDYPYLTDVELAQEAMLYINDNYFYKITVLYERNNLAWDYFTYINKIPHNKNIPITTIGRFENMSLDMAIKYIINEIE